MNRSPRRFNRAPFWLVNSDMQDSAGMIITFGSLDIIFPGMPPGFFTQVASESATTSHSCGSSFAFSLFAFVFNDDVKLSTPKCSIRNSMVKSSPSSSEGVCAATYLSLLFLFFSIMKISGFVLVILHTFL